jgi:hypothetical protein
MKRILSAIFLVLILGGSVWLWWFLRDTPEKALRNGILGMINLKTAKNLELDLSWTDLERRTTTGFGYAGQADLKSWTRPRALGVIRLGAASAETENMAGDLVVEDVALALRPRSVSSAWRAYAESLSKDATGGTFLVIDRDAFLEWFKFDKAISNAAQEKLKLEAAFFIPTLIPTSGLKASESGSKQTISVSFRVDRVSIEPVLLALVKAWMSDNPTPDEYRWAEAAAASLASGEFELTIDGRTRKPLNIKGTFSQVDAGGKKTRAVSFALSLDGHDQKVEIGIPEQSREVTQETVKREQPKGVLPQAQLRTLPGSATGTGGFKPYDIPTSTGKMIDERETDLFDKYYEEMLRKKKLY